MRNERIDAAAGLDPELMAGGAREREWVRRLATTTDRDAGADLADTVHSLCVLYGRAAGLIDSASLRVNVAEERDYLIRALTGWEGERAVLAQLAVAVGPLPSTPDQTADHTAILAQADALAVLATSERNGVALGSAAALVVDWHGVRPLLNRAAERFGTIVSRCTLPSDIETLAMLAGQAADPGMARAIRFGARQLLRQHDALIDRLESRSARRTRS